MYLVDPLLALTAGNAIVVSLAACKLPVSTNIMTATESA